MEPEEANVKIIPRKLLFWITIVIAIGLILLSLLSIYFVFIYPENQVSQLGITNVTEKANFINQTRTTFISFFVLFAQILGGGAVAIGIYIGWGNLKVALATLESNQNKARDELKLAQDALIADQNKARDELKIAQDTLEANMQIAQENLKVAQEGQITERFTRAVEQLGAIDQLGNPIIEIRLGGIYALERISMESEKDYWPIMKILTAYVRKNSSIEDQKVKEQNEVSEDIQAILTIIGKHNQKNVEESRTLNLKNTFLHKANLEKAHLEGADLTDSILTEAYLKKTNLEGAYLSNVNFYHAILSGADLKQTHIERAIFERAVLKEVDLSGVDANLGANFSGANLERSNLRKIKLWGADLSGANLKEGHLEGANLEDAYLKKAKLQGTYLETALLSRADLTGANFEGANLEGVNLRETDLRGAKNLEVDQLSKAKTLYKAELDEGLEEELRAKGFGHLLDDEPKE